MQDLLGIDDTTDPLRHEMNGVPEVEKGVLTSTPMDSNSKKRRIDTDSETDQVKKTKTETEKESSREDIIVKAIERATSMIVDALDRNTRATRVNETSIGKVADELAHMSRVLARRQDTRPEPKEVLKENRIKSVVIKKK